MLGYFRLKTLVILLNISIVIPVQVQSQHRGDNLAFQGMANPNVNGVKALAMGGAYTSISGDINSLFWNPAGLAGIESYQLSISANSYEKHWRENQVYRPNRQFVNMSFILEGLYVPNPANNGLYDFDAFLNDSTYSVNTPELGQDVYSEEAADWQRSADDFGFDYLAGALPFRIGGKRFVISGAYNRQYTVLDYDRNQTYLDPHIGTSQYGPLVDRVTEPADSTRVYWSDYQRDRSGDINNLTFALAYEVNRHIKLGLTVNRFSGETDDMRALDRLGYFDLVDDNEFRFSYDTLGITTSGVSELKSTNLNIGTIVEFDHFGVGLNFLLPYTVTRDWRYDTVTSTVEETTTLQSSGEDKLEVPLSYTVGLYLRPVRRFRISLDIQQLQYNDAEFKLATGDTTHRDWVDQTIWRIGMAYQPFDFLSLLAGYRNLPQAFVPDGAAIEDEGPVADSFTFGVSINALSSRFDIAYEIRRLNYFDAYFSNTNYSLETFNNLMFGYTFMF